jgi:hypothetical protein
MQVNLFFVRIREAFHEGEAVRHVDENGPFRKTAWIRPSLFAALIKLDAQTRNGDPPRRVCGISLSPKPRSL